jgi:hypothetical protein
MSNKVGYLISVIQLIKKDMRNMLIDFELSLTEEYWQELNNYNDFHLNFPILEAWYSLLSQYIPKCRYTLDRNCNIFKGLSQGHVSSIEALIFKLENGLNINSQNDCFLPKIKSANHIDLLKEQSKTFHFHIPINKNRCNEIIYAQIDLDKKLVILHQLATHKTMADNYFNEDYYSHFVSMSLPASKNAEINKKEEYIARTKGWTPIKTVNNRPGFHLEPRSIIFNIINGMRQAIYQHQQIDPSDLVQYYKNYILDYVFKN